MSKIFELFGYRLDAWNDEATANRAQARCPFMDAECDGGGNRYLSAIDLRKSNHLKNYFPGKEMVQCGVCSLRVRDREQPWIVCPRRLLTLRSNVHPDHQETVKKQLAKYAKLDKGNRYKVWSEVKMKVETTNDDDEAKSFDYTFDYVMTGTKRMPLSQASDFIGKSEKGTRTLAESNGLTIAQRGGIIWIDDFPSDPVTIIEIMTSSTSGGDKNKRTQISMAFEDAIVNPFSHNGPGINYRQVWARMVSQLIVKSQVGIAWGGRTIWLLQDLLANYISSTTALDLSRYIAAHPDEVNILSFGYGESIDKKPTPITPLDQSTFYAGPISEKNGGGRVGFVEIVKIGAPPPKEHLWRSLFKKAPCGFLQN